MSVIRRWTIRVGGVILLALWVSYMLDALGLYDVGFGPR